MGGDLNLRLQQMHGPNHVVPPADAGLAETERRMACSSSGMTSSIEPPSFDHSGSAGSIANDFAAKITTDDF